jgi:hypothetical protein
MSWLEAIVKILEVEMLRQQQLFLNGRCIIYEIAAPHCTLHTPLKDSENVMGLMGAPKPI